MKKIAHYISLENILTNIQYSDTNYSKSLENDINRLIDKNKLEEFNEKIPIANFKYSKKTILTAFHEQGFVIELFNHEKYLICCNPYNKTLRKKFTQINVILVSPIVFIHYLSHQYKNSTEGLLNILLFFADEYNSTDIHLSKNEIKIKKNQLTQTHFYIQTNQFKEIIYYLKLKGNLDPNMSLKPQDGSFSINNKEVKIDLRIASLPTDYEEMISLRLFKPNSQLTTLTGLGFNKQKVTTIEKMLTNKNGLILIVGTTGSGKSTTLYTLLRLLKEKHIITIEDPIEQTIPNIHQTALNEPQGYTYENGLKAILRHNPDIIVIGEIRDKKTAQIALNAAYTGHLVIASLHTNNIESTLLRLENLGCDSFLISYCLRGVISQTLSFKNSNIELESTILYCKKPYIIRNIKNEIHEFIKNNQKID